MNSDNIFEIIALGNHQGDIRSIERGIRTLTRSISVKWAGDYVYPFLGLEIVRGVFSNISVNYDIISPVPSHDNSIGPAQFFSEVLSNIWNIPEVSLLFREREQKSAHDAVERPSIEDHKRTMAVNVHSDLLRKKVLLVDNVIATGSTIAAALELLHDNGYCVAGICCISIDEMVFNPDLIREIIKPKVLKFRYIYREGQVSSILETI